MLFGILHGGAETYAPAHWEDPHLRSTRQVTGYHAVKSVMRKISFLSAGEGMSVADSP
jgi:hypothetical protein